MASAQNMQKLDEILSRAGEQWRDEDLDDIMALLDKDYTKPQQKKTPVVQEPDEFGLFLDPEKFSEEPAETVSRRSMELPDLSSLIPQEDEAVACPLPEQLRLDQEAEETSVRPAYDLFAPREEFVPQEARWAGIGEQPDFDETPEKPKKEWLTIPLGILAAVEIAAIVGIIIWWQQWIV